MPEMLKLKPTFYSSRFDNRAEDWTKCFCERLSANRGEKE
jgi:hypothetical protein